MTVAQRAVLACALASERFAASEAAAPMPLRSPWGCSIRRALLSLATSGWLVRRGSLWTLRPDRRREAVLEVLSGFAAEGGAA